jgi:hypothetical protein
MAAEAFTAAMGGSVTIVNSVISGNHADGGQYPYGGGVTGDSLTIIISTISGNSAVGGFPLTFGARGRYCRRRDDH